MLKTVLLQKIKPYRRVNKKGFTLMEMLIVVAIIAILIAVAIPVFSAQLHKARVATDWANLRSFYADIQTDYMTFLQLSGKLHIKRRLKSCIHCVIITCSAHSPLSIAAKWRISVLMCRLKDFVGCTEQ